MVTDRRRAARPALIRAVVAGALVMVGLVVTSFFRLDRRDDTLSTDDIVVLAGTVLIAVAGVIAIRSVAAAAQTVSGGPDRTKGTPLGFLISLVGYLLLALIVVGALGFQLDKLLVGGAVTGVVLGIAAQQTIGNVFAGIVLLVVRPFSVGDIVYLKGALGEYQGGVTDMTLFYVHLATEQGPVMLPNAGVLASAVGPGARAEKQKEREEEQQEPSAE